jgi:hypothetical protein
MAKIQLEIEYLWSPVIPQANDHMFKDLAVTYNLAPKVLKVLNRCWLYLQVLTLSNIDGKTILPEAIQGAQIPHRTGWLEWPNQSLPILLRSYQGKHTILLSLPEYAPHEAYDIFVHPHKPILPQLLALNGSFRGLHPVLLLHFKMP